MIYAKTEAGQQAFKERSSAFSPRQRSAFILIDGKHDDREVLASTAGLGVSETDIAHLLAMGMIRPVEPAPAVPAVSVVAAAPVRIAPIQLRPTDAAVEEATVADEAGDPQALYLRAWPLATQLTAGLGLRGFRLNLAVEKAANYDELMVVLPKIREAVGAEKFRVLDGFVRH